MSFNLLLRADDKQSSAALLRVLVGPRADL